MFIRVHLRLNSLWASQGACNIVPKTRLAVIGAGQFGKNHCRVIRESERAELVAVADTDAERAALALTEAATRRVDPGRRSCSTALPRGCSAGPPQ